MTAGDTPKVELSKTERRRIAKKAKKERLYQEKMEKKKARALKYAPKNSEIHGSWLAGKRVNPEDKKKTCLKCRKRGHQVAQCPESGGTTNSGGAGICYNCGRSGHAVRACPKPKIGDGFAHALCYICQEKGHLSNSCPQSKRGIYPKGGNCHECGEITHLAKDCPLKKQQLENDKKRRQDEKDELLVTSCLEPDAAKAKAGVGSGASSTTGVAKNVNKKPKVVNF